MLEAVIFDMDGVIIDSEPFFHESEQLVLKKRGHDVPLDYFYQFQGTTHSYMWGLMKENFDLPDEVSDLVNEATSVREALIEEKGMTAIPHVLEFIDHLSTTDIPLAIASSSPRKDIEKTIEMFDLHDVITYYVSGNQVENSKPFPDIFLNVSSKLNLNPENCLVIEDSANGVRAGSAAGMKVIGYRNTNFPAPDHSKADKVITTFEGLRIEDLQSI
ncbi:HAD family hydrolase [Alkalibacterium sp. MB6]|uniref:HAD family hydrolase n=1 Tax=Alkalibacterium sp. MB6 TaxID=2081965 RepID=UPI0013798509|nr:HAD family phosphatase [Alkalibacterium sp. MB6]